jgi:hypothetical protein
MGRWGGQLTRLQRALRLVAPPLLGSKRLINSLSAMIRAHRVKCSSTGWKQKQIRSLGKSKEREKTELKREEKSSQPTNIPTYPTTE